MRKNYLNRTIFKNIKPSYIRLLSFIWTYSGSFCTDNSCWIKSDVFSIHVTWLLPVILFMCWKYWIRCKLSCMAHVKPSYAFERTSLVSPISVDFLIILSYNYALNKHRRFRTLKFPARPFKFVSSVRNLSSYCN